MVGQAAGGSVAVGWKCGGVVVVVAVMVKHRSDGSRVVVTFDERGANVLGLAVRARWVDARLVNENGTTMPRVRGGSACVETTDTASVKALWWRWWRW